MVETITPVVHGGRARRWVGAVALHAAGASASAAAFGAALGAAGGLLGAPWGVAGAVLVAAVAALYAARELGGLAVPLPDRRKQVPEWWRTFFPPPVAAFLYGAALGIGFLTFLRFGTLVAVTAAAFASGDPLVGALMIGPFGLARGLSVAVAASGRSDEAVARVIDRLEHLAESRLPRLVNGAVLVAVGAAALLAGLPAGGGTPHPATAWAVAVVFAWAAVSKLWNRAAWRDALRAQRVPPPLERWALPGVPLAEAAVPGLILAGHVTLGASLALVLLAVFTAFLVRARRLAGGRLPCGCFGGRRTRDVRWLLGRNVAVAALAAAALGAPSAHSVLRLPQPGEFVPAALVAVGLVLALLLVRRTAWALRRV
jgi:hypothetical protein